MDENRIKALAISLYDSYDVRDAIITNIKELSKKGKSTLSEEQRLSLLKSRIDSKIINIKAIAYGPIYKTTYTYMSQTNGSIQTEIFTMTREEIETFLNLNYGNTAKLIKLENLRTNQIDYITEI